MRVFNLPDLGEGLQEAEIVEWHVAPGDGVTADQTIVSVETDKAIVEIPAPYPGRLEKRYGEAGDIVHVGAPLAGFEGEAPDSGTVVGEIASEEEEKAAPVAKSPAWGAVRAMPAARALARRLGVALEAITPTGPEGVITAGDVRLAAGEPAAREDKPAQPAPAQPLRGMRRAMARNMALAHAEVAAVTLMDDADVDAWPEATALMPRLVRAIVAACRAEPGLNAWYDPKSGSRRMFDEVHIGVAVDTRDGLLVPVLRGCESRSSGDLAAALAALARDARARKLPPGELRGATITLSNYGAIAGRYASPIVVPPAIAILGAGRLAPRPVVNGDGQIVAHRVLPLSLTFDHRAASGGEAGRFLLALIADLQRGS